MFDQNENGKQEYLLYHEHEATQLKRHHDHRLNGRCPEEVVELVTTDRAHRDAKEAAHARHSAERALGVVGGQRRVFHDEGLIIEKRARVLEVVAR
jgi:hypothetical protein